MYDNIKFVRGGSLCLENGGLAQGTAGATIKLVAPNGLTIDYAIDGLLFSRNEGDNLAITPTAASGTTQAILTTCLYAVMVDNAQNLTVKKGVEVLTSDLANGVKVLNWPFPDLARCVIGYFKVVNVSAPFILGTTLLNAAGVTTTYYNTMCPPTYPLTS